VSNLPYIGLKRVNRMVVAPLKHKRSVARHPSFHSNPHEPINTPIICVHYVALCGSDRLKPSVYAGVPRINSPLTHPKPSILKGGGGGGVSPCAFANR
jgi:hypothetical protein